MIHIFTIAKRAIPATTGRNPRLKCVGRSAFIRDTLGIFTIVNGYGMRYMTATSVMERLTDRRKL